MKTYTIKIAVRGISPMVWHRLRIAVDTSLAALHFIFQIVQGWGHQCLPGATAVDEADKTLAFLEAIANADDATTVGDIRAFIDDLDTVRFNRKKINKQLNSGSVGVSNRR